MGTQIKSCTHSGNHKQQKHKPGIQNVKHCVLVLNRFQRSDSACLPCGIKYVKHMVDYNKSPCNPANIIYIYFSHSHTYSSAFLPDSLISALIFFSKLCRSQCDSFLIITKHNQPLPLCKAKMISYCFWNHDLPSII